MMNRALSPKRLEQVVEVFHGTSAKRAERILAEQLMTNSENRGDWLGSGIYFWENSAARALKWATDRHPAAPAVLRARIKLGLCLDLFDVKWFPVLNQAHKELGEAAVAAGNVKELPTNAGSMHNLDCAIVNWVCEHMYNVETVRGPFFEGDRLFESSQFLDLTHIQISVRVHSNVVGPIARVF
jgi:hypothetical protein